MFYVKSEDVIFRKQKVAIKFKATIDFVLSSVCLMLRRRSVCGRHEQTNLIMIKNFISSEICSS